MSNGNLFMDESFPEETPAEVLKKWTNQEGVSFVHPCRYDLLPELEQEWVFVEGSVAREVLNSGVSQPVLAEVFATSSIDKSEVRINVDGTLRPSERSPMGVCFEVDGAPTM